MSAIKVENVPAPALVEPLNLLETALRASEPVLVAFAAELRASVERGETEVLLARLNGHPAGVVLVAYRLNISAGGRFASIEELQVVPQARATGIGRALLEAAVERCVARGISYLEVQTDDEAVAFYKACGFEAEPEVRVLSRSGTISPKPEA